MVDSTLVTNNSNNAPVTSKSTSSQSNTEKWGEALNDGFVMIPSALLRHQYKLGLSNGEVVVLMNLLMSWWKINDSPHIQSGTIAKRMKTTSRSVQRHIESLQEKGFLRRVWSKRKTDERAGASYDLLGTVAKLQELGRTAHPTRSNSLDNDFDDWNNQWANN